MIKHNPILDIEKICKYYSSKENVPVTYVCTSSLGHDAQAMDIFYREAPHPEFGNRYFGLFLNNRQHPESSDQSILICNADKVEKLEFGLVEDGEGNLQYSSHRWDYKKFKNCYSIDGGRAYVRTGMHPVHMYVVVNGEMKEKSYA